jgi:hypothetical protein
MFGRPAERLATVRHTRLISFRSEPISARTRFPNASFFSLVMEAQPMYISRYTNENMLKVRAEVVAGVWVP